jgi:hypothetical protein
MVLQQFGWLNGYTFYLSDILTQLVSFLEGDVKKLHMPE